MLKHIAYNRKFTIDCVLPVYVSHLKRKEKNESWNRALSSQYVSYFYVVGSMENNRHNFRSKVLPILRESDNK